MKPKVEEIFELILSEMRTGRTIDDCLKDYPEYRDELEPLLKLSRQMEDLPKPEPAPVAVESAINRARAVVAEYRDRPIPAFLPRLFTKHPVLIRVAAALIIIVMIGWGGVSFSAQSLPGHFLYPVKRLTENVRSTLMFTADGRAELHIAFARTRNDEMLKTYRPGDKINKGLLNAMLNESRSARIKTECCSADKSRRLLAEINAVNRDQRNILERIKTRVCPCDSTVVSEALRLCAMRDACLNQGSCSECTCGQDVCTCPWDVMCRWK
jgi:hypothetical protein